MKRYRVTYSVSYWDAGGDFDDIEAETEDEAERIAEDRIERGWLDDADIRDIDIEVEELEELPEPKFIDPSQIDWVEEKAS